MHGQALTSVYENGPSDYKTALLMITSWNRDFYTLYATNFYVIKSQHAYQYQQATIFGTAGQQAFDTYHDAYCVRPKRSFLNSSNILCWT